MHNNLKIKTYTRIHINTHTHTHTRTRHKSYIYTHTYKQKHKNTHSQLQRFCLQKNVRTHAHAESARLESCKPQWLHCPWLTGAKAEIPPVNTTNSVIKTPRTLSSNDHELFNNNVRIPSCKYHKPCHLNTTNSAI